MTPTEHELTVATETLARADYARAVEHMCDHDPARVAQVRTWDQLPPIERHPILDAALPIAVAVLDALPDRAAPLVAELEHQRIRRLTAVETAVEAAEVRALRTLRQATRYRLAWRSARRRARQLVEALDTYADVPIALALDETTSTVQHRPTGEQTPDGTPTHTQHPEPSYDLELLNRLSPGRTYWPCAIRTTVLVHTDGRCPHPHATHADYDSRQA